MKFFERPLQKALYTIGSFAVGSALLGTVACTQPDPTPTPTATPTIARPATPTPQSVIPIQRPTATLTPTSTLISTPTQIVYGIREKNLERLLSDLFTYYNVDERDRLVNEIKSIQPPKMIQSSNTEETLKVFANDFNRYKIELTDSLSRFEDFQRNMDMFQATTLEWPKDCRPGPNFTVVSYQENITNALNDFEENLQRAEKYGDTTLINIGDLTKISNSLNRLIALNETYKCTYGGDLYTWNVYVTPSASILIDYFKFLGKTYSDNIRGSVIGFTVQLNNNDELATVSAVPTEIGTLLGPPIIIPNSRNIRSSRHPQPSLLEIPITSDTYAKVSLILQTGTGHPVEKPWNRFGPYNFGYAVFKFNSSDDATKTWDSHVSSGDLKLDGQYCVVDLCFDRVFWKKEGGGNFYSYGKQSENYILIINPSPNIWEEWKKDGRSYTSQNKMDEFLSYLIK